MCRPSARRRDAERWTAGVRPTEKLVRVLFPPAEPAPTVRPKPVSQPHTPANIAAKAETLIGRQIGNARRQRRNRSARTCRNARARWLSEFRHCSAFCRSRAVRETLGETLWFERRLRNVDIVISPVGGNWEPGLYSELVLQLRL